MTGFSNLEAMVTVTHRIDEELKRELDEFCAAHGLKMQAVVQEALASWLEDHQDLAQIEARREGPWVDWDDARDDL